MRGRLKFGMIAIGCLGLMGCSSGSVVIRKIPQIPIAAVAPPAPQTAGQTVQALKEPLLPPDNPTPSNSQNTPSTSVLPAVELEDLEPAIPPAPVSNPNCCHLTPFNQQSSGVGGTPISGGHSHDPQHETVTSATLSNLTSQPNHFLNISDVVLTDTGESIVGPDALAAITAAYDEDHTVSITIHGDFRTAPQTNLENMVFLNEPGLLHLSQVGKEPSVRVLLDSQILWTPIEASETKIVAELNTKGIPDLWLKGAGHVLSVEAGQLISQTKVKVGDPIVGDTPPSLSPVIDSVEVLRDEDGKPINLRVTGKNLMMYYRFSYAQIDSVFAFGHQTSVLQGDNGLSWEAIVHIPDPDTFDDTQEHTISYSSPFGATFKAFTAGGAQ